MCQSQRDKLLQQGRDHSHVNHFYPRNAIDIARVLAMGCMSVHACLSASRGPSAIAELLVAQAIAQLITSAQQVNLRRQTLPDVAPL